MIALAAAIRVEQQLSAFRQLFLDRLPQCVANKFRGQRRTDRPALHIASANSGHLPSLTSSQTTSVVLRPIGLIMVSDQQVVISPLVEAALLELLAASTWTWIVPAYSSI
jgi:hypothetical protein